MSPADDEFWPELIDPGVDGSGPELVEGLR